MVHYSDNFLENAKTAYGLCECLKRREEPLDAVRYHPCRAARGERSKEVASHLGISERTVKAHLASIYNKLGVDSRAAAIAVAAQKGLLKDHCGESGSGLE